MLRAIESYHHYYYYYFIINVFSIFIITIIIIIITVIGPVVCMSFCLSVCLSVGLLQKWWANFVETWNYDWVYQLEELINFWWWSGLGYEFRITFPLPLLCRIGHFRSFISISHTVTETTDPDKGKNSLQVGSNLVDLYLDQYRSTFKLRTNFGRVFSDMIGNGRGMLPQSTSCYYYCQVKTHKMQKCVTEVLWGNGSTANELVKQTSGWLINNSGCQSSLA